MDGQNRSSSGVNWDALTDVPSCSTPASGSGAWSDGGGGSLTHTEHGWTTDRNRGPTLYMVGDTSSAPLLLGRRKPGVGEEGTCQLSTQSNWRKCNDTQDAPDLPRLVPTRVLYAALGLTLLILGISELLQSDAEGVERPTRLTREVRLSAHSLSFPALPPLRQPPSAGGAATEVQPGKLSLPPVVIDEASSGDTYFMASPSITKLPDGRLLTVYEKQPFGSKLHPHINYHKTAAVSSDGGQTWEVTGRVGRMLWPQLINCKSGIYVIGAQTVFGPENNVVISKMLSANGSEWTDARPITQSRSVMFGNTGVDVSRGLVTKAFEHVPALSRGSKTSTGLLEDLHIRVSELTDASGHTEHEEITARVLHPDDFVLGELVKLNSTETHVRRDYGAAKDLGVHDGRITLFFRVTGMNVTESKLYLRPEKYNAYFFQGNFVIPRRTRFRIASGSVLYGDQDFRSLAIQAPEDADLTDPHVWVESNHVGNPASVHRTAVKELLGLGHLTNNRSREYILDFDPVLLERLEHVPEDQLENAFGNLYALEGVVTRLQDRRTGDNSLQILLRVNNNVNCNLGAIVSLTDSQTRNTEGAGLRAEFKRYTFAPGASVAHPAIAYDPVADVYWYVNNVVRDSQAVWDDSGHDLHISKNSLCEVDRSSLGLFYSANAIDWHFAGFIDYHLEYVNHYSYPQMLIDGDDLLLVARATMPKGPRGHGSKTYNNHNSNAISFHRVPNFRSHAHLEWVTHQSPFMIRPTWNTSTEH